VTFELPQMITAKQLNVKYPVEMVTSLRNWYDHLKFWRDTNILVLDRHWMMLHLGRRSPPEYGYTEPCVLFLVRRDAKEDEFCHMVYREHKDVILATISKYIASRSK
jgi:hypothetical protein